MCGIVLSTIPQASATLYFSYAAPATGTNSPNKVYPNYEAGYQSSLAQKVVVTSAFYITDAEFLLHDISTAPVTTYTLGAKLLDYQFNIIENSTTTYSRSDLTDTDSYSSATWKTFTFSGNTQLTTANGGVYYIGLFLLSMTGSTGANSFSMVQCSITPYHIWKYTNTWAEVSAQVCINVHGTASAPATPSPTPAPSNYLWWNGSAWVSYTPATPEPNIFDNGVATPYITMLVPVVLLAVAALLGWKFAGAWGFFAGLNLGAILCYVILGSSVFPLWGVVALLIVDGLLLFGKVGFRS